MNRNQDISYVPQAPKHQHVRTKDNTAFSKLQLNTAPFSRFIAIGLLSLSEHHILKFKKMFKFDRQQSF